MGSGIWGRCCGGSGAGGVCGTTCQVGLRLMAEGGWVGGCVRWEPWQTRTRLRLSKAQTNSRGSQWGSRRRKTSNKQASREGFFFLFFSLLSNSNKEPFKMYLLKYHNRAQMGLTFIDKVQCSDSIRGALSLPLEQQSNLKTSCSDSVLMEVHHWSVSANYFFATSRSHRTLQYAAVRMPGLQLAA